MTPETVMDQINGIQINEVLTIYIPENMHNKVNKLVNNDYRNLKLTHVGGEFYDVKRVKSLPKTTLNEHVDGILRNLTNEWQPLDMGKYAANSIRQRLVGKAATRNINGVLHVRKKTTSKRQVLLSKLDDMLPGESREIDISDIKIATVRAYLPGSKYMTTVVDSGKILKVHRLEDISEMQARRVMKKRMANESIIKNIPKIRNIKTIVAAIAEDMGVEHKWCNYGRDLHVMNVEKRVMALAVGETMYFTDHERKIVLRTIVATAEELATGEPPRFESGRDGMQGQWWVKRLREDDSGTVQDDLDASWRRVILGGKTIQGFRNNMNSNKMRSKVVNGRLYVQDLMDVSDEKFTELVWKRLIDAARGDFVQLPMHRNDDSIIRTVGSNLGWKLSPGSKGGEWMVEEFDHVES